MVIQRNEMQVEQRERMRDGEGTLTLTHLTGDNTQKNVRLVGEFILPPGSSIGKHQHNDETEYFIFLEGTGTVDDNGIERPVKKGDMMITGDGGAHSVKNTGSEPLVFNAVIVTH
ncbi:MAG: cupin domain-containing protein [Spirochaetaceae bacterium]|jgi:mannose-6-phosphate isomerase-like protein (cupin superfamily)|nr:cupin domain-containing protein [Spirochaetaceae bacterium]